MTIIDDAIVAHEDLGCQFFLRIEDVGKCSRAAASQANMQALNPLAKVLVEVGSASSLTEERHVFALHVNFDVSHDHEHCVG